MPWLTVLSRCRHSPPLLACYAVATVQMQSPKYPRFFCEIKCILLDCSDFFSHSSHARLPLPRHCDWLTWRCTWLNFYHLSYSLGKINAANQSACRDRCNILPWREQRHRTIEAPGGSGHCDLLWPHGCLRQREERKNILIHMQHYKHNEITRQRNMQRWKDEYFHCLHSLLSLSLSLNLLMMMMIRNLPSVIYLARCCSSGCVSKRNSTLPSRDLDECLLGQMLNKLLSPYI